MELLPNPVLFAPVTDCNVLIPNPVFVEILLFPRPILIPFTEISRATNNRLFNETSPIKFIAPLTTRALPILTFPLISTFAFIETSVPNTVFPTTNNVFARVVAPVTANVLARVVDPVTANVLASVTAPVNVDAPVTANVLANVVAPV